MSVPEPSSLEAYAGDGTERLSKITSDFQKIRSQNAILKKAVLQEQQKVVELERDLKGKELKLRQFQEENDILQFNNTRLTKRVSSLQEELAEPTNSAQKSKSEGGWFFGSSRELAKKIEELEVIRSELRVKIKENEQLHFDTTDLQQELNQAKQVHTEQVSALKACVKAKQDEADAIVAQMTEYKGRLTRAQEDLDRLIHSQKEKDNKLTQDIKQFMESMRQARANLRTNVGDDSKGSFPLSLSVDDLIHDIKGDDEEVYLHQQQQQQHSSDPEATTSSESEDGPSEVSVLFGTLSQAVAAHWMAHIDKLELERKKGLWRRSEQLQQICTELQAILPTLPPLLDKVAQQAPLHLPLTGNLPAKLREDLQHFLHACKKWLTYQQLRHQELSQLATVYPSSPQLNSSVPPVAQLHRALADSHLAIFNSFDRLVSDREQQGLATLLTQLQALATHSAAWAQMENDSDPDMIHLNEQIISSQTRALSLVSELTTAISASANSSVPSGQSSLNGSGDIRQQAGPSSFARRSFGGQGSPRSPAVGGFRFRTASIYLNRLIEDCQLIIHHRDERMEGLKQEMSGLQAQLVTNQDALSSRQAQINSLLAELKTARNKAEQLNDQCTQIKNQLQDQQIANEQQVKVLEQKLEDEAQKLANTENDLRTKAEEYSAVRQQLNSQGSVALEREQKLRAEHEAALHQIRILEHKVHELEISLEAKVVQAQTLQQRLYTVEQRASESAKQVLILEQRASEKDRAIQELQAYRDNEGAQGMDGAEGALSGSGEIPNVTGGVEVKSPVSTKSDDSNASPQIMNRRDSMIRARDTSVPRYEMTVMDATGQQTTSLAVSETDKEREKQLIQHYETRASGLIAQAQAADAKALQLYDQHAGLLNALYEKEREKEALLAKIQEANTMTQATKDDLEDTRHNYDNQIHIMTEHILGLQESVTKVEGDLADVKSHKVQCAKCKAWNTIDWLLGEGKGGQKCIKGGHAVAPFML